MSSSDLPDGFPAQCPFLGQSLEAHALICLADVDPVAVSRRYGDSYCLTPGHVNCSLYIAAILADRSKAPPVLEPEIVPERVAITAETAEPEHVPLTREQSIELAEDLSRVVEALVERVRQRRAANEALLRQMRTLQEMAENPAFLRRMLATGEREPMSAEDIDALQTSLQALIANPHNLGGLVTLAERSAKLEQAVNACLHIFRTLG